MFYYYRHLLLIFIAIETVLGACSFDSRANSQGNCFTTSDVFASADYQESVSCKYESPSGHLAYVFNAFDNAQAKMTAAADNVASKYFFLGGHRNCTNCTWTWTLGTTVNYTNWGTGHPVNGYNCMVMDVTDGKWYSVKCNSTFPALCVEPPVPDCPSGWTLFNETKSCYKVFPGFMQTDAQEQCDQALSHIASIHSGSENAFVTQLATTNTSQNGDKGITQMTWTGLKYDNETNSFQWSDGTPLGYTNWAKSGKEPNLTAGLCVALASDSYSGNGGPFSLGEWFTYPCNRPQRVVVCQQRAASEKSNSKESIFV